VTSVAALFVDPKGIYAGLPDVELWDEARDARLYDGPFPVVAHPPCKSWSLMGQCRPEIVRGDDGGCFEAALGSVQAFGGVLEHPAHTHAWRAFGLPTVFRGCGWTCNMIDPGWVCEVDQARYGHPANKRTWLYYVGDQPPAGLHVGPAPFTGRTVRNDGGGGRDQRSKTPEAFRDALLELARASVPTAFVGPPR
jgi:hypothetical protein